MLAPLFCTCPPFPVRIAAFTIRAVLAGLDSAGENFSLLIADQVLTSVGFFGLLYSAYTLVLDRYVVAESPIYRPSNRDLVPQGAPDRSTAAQKRPDRDFDECHEQ